MEKSPSGMWPLQSATRTAPGTAPDLVPIWTRPSVTLWCSQMPLCFLLSNSSNLSSLSMCHVLVNARAS
eukprot:1158299-Pelagomonas_calceolata.AAC.7